MDSLFFKIIGFEQYNICSARSYTCNSYYNHNLYKQAEKFSLCFSKKAKTMIMIEAISVVLKVQV